MKATHDRVKKLLEELPSTRESDRVLYVEYIRRYHPELVSAPFDQVMARTDISSIESVGRARRKCMELYPYLRGSEKISTFRELKEEEYREYAIEVKA